jgi:two-component system, NarL family, sensor kinase
MDIPEKVSLYATLLIGVTLIFFSLSCILIWFIFLLQKNQYKNLYTELLRVSIESQEQEREKIAQELHDEVSSVLAAAKMKIAFLPEIWDNCQLRKNIIDESKKLLDISLNQIRDLSHELSPTYLITFGLKDSLKYFLENLKEHIAIRFTYDIQENLSYEHQLTFYRIALELVHNTLKHAQASQVSILFLEENNHLIFRYYDNGIGLSKTILKDKKGLGLKNIENRINALKGNTQFVNVSSGFALQINLSLKIHS